MGGNLSRSLLAVGGCEKEEEGVVVEETAACGGGEEGEEEEEAAADRRSTQRDQRSRSVRGRQTWETSGRRRCLSRPRPNIHPGGFSENNLFLFCLKTKQYAECETLALTVRACWRGKFLRQGFQPSTFSLQRFGD